MCLHSSLKNPFCFSAMAVLIFAIIAYETVFDPDSTNIFTEGYKVCVLYKHAKALFQAVLCINAFVSN